MGIRGAFREVLETKQWGKGCPPRLWMGDQVSMLRRRQRSDGRLVTHREIDQISSCIKDNESQLEAHGAVNISVTIWVLIDKWIYDR